MRYAIYFTPPLHDPLSIAASSWLGRNVYTGEPAEPQPIGGFSMQEIAFHTALPRRYGFHATIKAPFRLADGMTESGLLRALMCFAGTIAPFDIPVLEVSRLGHFYGLAPSIPNEQMNHLAARVVQEFDEFRAPLTEAEIERRDPDTLTAPQFSNLHRWGYPYVMDEFRFHMMLTGPVNQKIATRIETALRQHFDPVLVAPVRVASLALFVEQEAGSPFKVHSQHPLGKVSVRRTG